MESLCNYASDDDNNTPSPKREVINKLTRTNGMEADANYEQVTMEMSEESNHSSTKSSHPKDQTSPSSSASSPTSISQTSRSHRTSKHENHSDVKTSSSDEEKIKSHSRQRRNKSRDRHSKKHSRRSRSRSNDRKRSRRSRSHSRSKKRSRQSHSRSERNGSSRRSSPYSRHESKNSHKKHSRSKSKEKFTTHNYFLEKKANNKRQILDKLGIELKVPSIGSSTTPSTQVTPQQLLQKSMEAQVEKVKVQTGIELPSYYNPVAVNPNKYAEQIQKRKLLWGNKQNNDVVKQVEESKPAVAAINKTATIWQSTKFGDQDGKVTAKFKRLMGIKDNEKGVDGPTSQQGQSKDIIKKQEEMFNSMESQYEVARMATHTHRGLGLGFGTFQQR
ncbi:arginine/serine-rich coiled-coil protein 2-like isoform X2 [Sipha flava]|uniref:Arginine/serine-rich coiled-coil protein 2-like isoform X2 n=1 Tax=Sipha flava TaxID=143950 RepID=A0A8B8FMA7_9HEMI|nr:arginine/serine-rich coiled-coil protein 2-like isoform X2 [Sipha flava]